MLPFSKSCDRNTVTKEKKKTKPKPKTFAQEEDFEKLLIKTSKRGT